MNGGAVEAVVGNLVKFPVIFYDAAACSAQGECRPDNCRKTDFIVNEIDCILVACDDLARNAWFPDCFHGVLKELSILGLVDSLRPCTQKLYIVPFKEA